MRAVVERSRATLAIVPGPVASESVPAIGRKDGCTDAVGWWGDSTSSERRDRAAAAAAAAGREDDVDEVLGWDERTESLYGPPRGGSSAGPTLSRSGDCVTGVWRRSSKTVPAIPRPACATLVTTARPQA